MHVDTSFSALCVEMCSDYKVLLRWGINRSVGWSLSLECMEYYNMLLVLSITFYFHYNTWGRMCSTGPFKYRWLKGYIYSSCYYHHQIGSIHLSHCFYIFPWLCTWDVCYIIFCLLLHIHSGKNREFVFISIVQFMMSANSRIRFGLHIVFVCLYITPSHHHHCANLIWRHWTYKMPIRHNLSSVWVRLSIFSQLSIIQYVGLCFFSVYQFPLWWLREYIYT